MIIIILIVNFLLLVNDFIVDWIVRYGYVIVLLVVLYDVVERIVIEGFY